MSITVNSVAEDWKKLSDTENSSSYARPTHTTKVPRSVIFKRKNPTRNGSDLGIATYTMKIVNGDVTDGLPHDRNTLCEITLRDPQANAASVMEDVIDVLQAVAADASLIPDLITGLIPQSDTL